MLKRVIINAKKVPVPVPIRTLDEALRWIEETLVPTGHTITRIVLDEQVLGEEGDEGLTGGLKLTEQTKLEVQIDSPLELAIQTLDAMRNLASVILGGLKPLAVDCWQSRRNVRPGELDSTCTDLGLILDLIDHVTALIDPAGPMTVDGAALLGIAALARRVAGSLGAARGNSDWKACAKLLLNKLEPLLKDLIAEAESLQIRVMTQPESETGVRLTRSSENRKAPTG